MEEVEGKRRWRGGGGGGEEVEGRGGRRRWRGGGGGRRKELLTLFYVIGAQDGYTFCSNLNPKLFSVNLNIQEHKIFFQEVRYT